VEKFIEALIDGLRAFARARLPAIERLFKRVFLYRDLALSEFSRLLRRSGQRTIFLIALMASVWALYLFLTTLSSTATPKPTHDAILKARFSGPVASEKIVILDIDERSIANMANSHGRWPWSRDVLADGLQKLEEFKVGALVFNVLQSEPDKFNPDGDAAMQIAAQLFRPAGFPLVRLAPENDALSELKVMDLPGSSTEHGSQDKTLAAIVPLFPTMHDRLGVASQKPDSDGIIRKYPYRWSEPGFELPSIIEATLESSNLAVAQTPKTFALNWRNKRGGYRRISFSDLYLNQLAGQDRAALEGAIVVLGVSAPGIGQTKATGIAPVVDDSEILATAIDDAINKTYLRMPPEWLILILNFCSIWSLYWIFSRQSNKSIPINRVFGLLQASLGSITLLSASYTNYLVDLTDSMTFALGVFGAIKFVQGFDSRWTRAKKGYRRLRKAVSGRDILVISFLERSLIGTSEARLQRDIEGIVGLDRTVRVDDLIGGESFLTSSLSTARIMIVLVNSEIEQRAVEQIVSADHLSPCHIESFSLKKNWDPEDADFAAEVGPVVIRSLNHLLSNP